MFLGQEPEEVARLGGVLGLARRGPFLELGRQAHRLGPHGRPVLHRRPDILEDGEEIGAEFLHPLAGRLAVDLDVDERLAGDDRVHHEVQPAALADQRHRDRVEQERHVVDDDLDDGVRGGPTVVVEGGRVDPDLGGAGRAVLGQVEVGEGGARQVDGVAADEVLDRRPLPVGRDEVLGGLGLRAVKPRPHVGRRPFQQAVPCFLERHRHVGTIERPAGRYC